MAHHVGNILRNKSAILCGTMASWWTGYHDTPDPYPVPQWGESSDVAGLALAAHQHAMYTINPRTVWRSTRNPISWISFRAYVWAEAEALLRTGWKP